MDITDESPLTKRPRTFDPLHCIICSDTLEGSSKGVVTKQPTPQGVQTILDVATARQDHVYEQIGTFSAEYIVSELKVSYHRICRANYTSKSHIVPPSATYMSQSTDAPSSSSTSDSSQCRRLSRSDTLAFDIRKQCFVCSSVDKRLTNKCREKLTLVSTGTGSTTRTKVLDAALRRRDEVVRMRMLLHPDLFAADAKYHRSCYSHFISELNIQSVSTKSSASETNIHDIAFKRLVKELEQTVLSHRSRQVVTLKEVRSKFTSLLIELGGMDELEADRYSSWKLKARLKSHFKEKISFFQRVGHSDFVCSSSITVGDALTRATELEAKVCEQELVSELSEKSISSEDTEEKLILHRASGILRRSIAGMKDSDTYILPEDMEKVKCRTFVPDILYDFIRWTVSELDYANVTSSSSEQLESNIKVVSVCHNIIALCQNIRTPMTLGTALYIHHTVGSKQVIEVLHSLGHCVSYDEVRRFLTSAAKCVNTQSEEVYVPHGIQPVDMESGNTIIHAAMDNFDQNEETLDGKHTTHSMAAVLYQCCTTIDKDGNIPRITKKTLDVTDCQEEQINQYDKPHNRPEPPTIADSSVLTVTHHTSDSKTKDFVWELARFLGRGTTSIPAWGGFNTVLSTTDVPVSTIRYLPFIHAPPTDLSTIYTTLLQLVRIAEKQGQSHIIVTADLAIYSKAQQIMWSDPPLLVGKVTMRMGGMHFLMAFIAGIGKLFGDGGLRELLTVSGVYADATVQLMLQGKQLNRAVRGIKLVSEAVSYLYFESAKAWSEEHGIKWLDSSTENDIKDLQYTFHAKDNISSTEIIDGLDVTSAAEAIEQFQAAGKAQSATFTFWNEFIDASHIMLRLLRAERDADFELHLNAVCEAIPFFVVSGRNNYAKYAPIYVAEMKALESQKPDHYTHLRDGGFVVRRTHNKFNCVATDQALEQTINRDAKSQGGVIGITQRKGGLLRWLLTRHVTGSYSEAMKQLCTPSRVGIHQELGASRRARDSSDVESIVNVLESQYYNPFDLGTVPDSLINIVTGQVASTEVKESLTTMNETGEVQMMKFAEKRLLKDTKSTSFWDPQPRCKTKTFADMRKPLASEKRKSVTCSSEVLFRRLLSVSNTRDIDLKKVLEHELAAVPPALFNDDGSMRKVNKSELAKKLESVCDEVHTLPKMTADDDNAAYIIDGMAVIQSLNDSMFKTFDDLAESVMKKVLRPLASSDYATDNVTLVFDRYDNTNSVKTMERHNRGGGDMTPSHLITGSREVPNYRLYLKSAANKSALALFVSQFIVSNAPSYLQPTKTVIVAGGFEDGKIVKSVSSSGVELLSDIFSTHEEADTRMLLHAIDLATGHTRIVVRCDDTDVLVLLLYYYSQNILSTEVYMHAGHVGKIITRERYIPIHTISNKLGVKVCQCLPAVHSLTGCDTTSGIYRIGKRTAYKKLVDNIDKFNTLSEFGISSSADSALANARQFVLLLYRKEKRPCNTLDELRYRLATTTDKTGAMLPPTEDAFKNHVLRAEYQTAVWCHSHVGNPSLKNPIECGWIRDPNHGLTPRMYDKDCAPVQLRDITHLFCSDTKCSVPRSCACLLAGLPCIDICTCTDCSNSTPQLDVSDDSDCECDPDD